LGERGNFAADVFETSADQEIGPRINAKKRELKLDSCSFAKIRGWF